MNKTVSLEWRKSKADKRDKSLDQRFGIRNQEEKITLKNIFQSHVSLVYFAETQKAIITRNGS